VLHKATAIQATGRRSDKATTGYWRPGSPPLGVCPSPLLLILLSSLGCDGRPHTAEREKWRVFSPEQNYEIALKAENADARRRAVGRIGRSRQAASEDAFAVLDAVARTDPNDQTRCVAIRVLMGYDDPRPVTTMLAILDPKPDRPEALPASPPVRWDATAALVEFQARGLIGDDRSREALDVLLRLALHDGNRDVKRTAVVGLGSFRDVRAVRALIAALRDKDYGIAHEAAKSLRALTGRDYQLDADGWESWLNAASDPFDSNAGAASQPATAARAN